MMRVDEYVTKAVEKNVLVPTSASTSVLEILPAVSAETEKAEQRRRQAR
jgi:hypothetical protein